MRRTGLATAEWIRAPSSAALKAIRFRLSIGITKGSVSVFASVSVSARRTGTAGGSTGSL